MSKTITITRPQKSETLKSQFQKPKKKPLKEIDAEWYKHISEYSPYSGINP